MINYDRRTPVRIWSGRKRSAQRLRDRGSQPLSRLNNGLAIRLYIGLIEDDVYPSAYVSDQQCAQQQAADDLLLRDRHYLLSCFDQRFFVSLSAIYISIYIYIYIYVPLALTAQPFYLLSREQESKRARERNERVSKSVCVLLPARSAEFVWKMESSSLFFFFSFHVSLKATVKSFPKDAFSTSASASFPILPIIIVLSIDIDNSLLFKALDFWASGGMIREDEEIPINTTMKWNQQRCISTIMLFWHYFCRAFQKRRKEGEKEKVHGLLTLIEEERRKRLIGVKTLFHTDIVVACMRVLACVCERASARVCMD